MAKRLFEWRVITVEKRLWRVEAETEDDAACLVTAGQAELLKYEPESIDEIYLYRPGDKP